MTRNFPQTREAWLYAVTEKVIRPWFVELGLRLPPRIRFGVGWPHNGAGSSTVAECYIPQVSGDGATEIIIGTNYSEPVRIVDAVVHELLHAALGAEHGHDRTFAQHAEQLGLVGKPTSTVAGEELERIVRERILPRFGAYPHASLDLGFGRFNPGPGGHVGGGGKRSYHEKPKQGVRQLKVSCHNDQCPTYDEAKAEGYIARTTQKWLDDFGAPICPACEQPLQQS